MVLRRGKRTLASIASRVIVHSVCTLRPAWADKHMLPDLLHGAEKKVWETRAIKDKPRQFMQPRPGRKI